MPSNFSPDFYESILEASDKGELWGVENSYLTPLEIQLILSDDFNWYIENQRWLKFEKVFAFGIASSVSILAIFLFSKLI